MGKEEDIEEYITELDEISKDMCVFPEKQTLECCDCYMCRVDFFNIVRSRLIKEIEDIK